MSKANPLAKALVVVDMQDYFLSNMDFDSDTGDTREEGPDVRMELITNVRREIEKAKADRLPIIVLEYANLENGFEDPKESYYYNRTTDDVRCLLRGYSRAYFVPKDEDAGHEEVLSVMHGEEPRLCLESYGWKGKPNKLRKLVKDNQTVDFTVVGVNASNCVFETCCGLVEYGHKVNVPADAALDTFTLAWAPATVLTEADGVRLTNMKRAAFAA